MVLDVRGFVRRRKRLYFCLSKFIYTQFDSEMQRQLFPHTGIGKDLLHNSGKHNATRALYPWIYWGVLAVLVLIAGVRGFEGADSFGYILSVVNEDWQGDTRLGAPGYTVLLYGARWLASLFRSWGGDAGAMWGAAALFTAIAAWFNTMAGRFIIRHSGNTGSGDCGQRGWAAWRWRFLALALYVLLEYVFLNFEVMRESIAIGFFLWSWDDWRRGRYGKFYLKIIGGALFHPMCAVMGVFPLLNVKFMRSITDNIARTLLSVAALWVVVVFLLPMGAPALEALIAKGGTLGDRAQHFYWYLYDDYGYASLNWRGMLWHGTLRVAVPLIVAWLCGDGAMRRSMFFMACMGAVSLELLAGTRYMNYLYIPMYAAMAGISCKLWVYRGHREWKILWFSGLVLYTVCCMREYWSPVGLDANGREVPRMELYWPYEAMWGRKEGGGWEVLPRDSIRGNAYGVLHSSYGIPSERWQPVPVNPDN